MFDNENYVKLWEKGDIRIYVPSNTTKFHTSRLVEAMRQNAFAGLSVTEEAYNAHLDAIIELCNQTGEIKTIRTDIGSIANAMKARGKFPIDEKCGMRLGIALCFIEFKQGESVMQEDPNKVDWYFLKKKEELAYEDPELFAFFLNWGIENSPKYKEASNTLSDMDYFRNRTMMLMEMLPKDYSALGSL